MKPILPARILGGAVVVESEPLSIGMAHVFRGVDLEGAADPAVAPPSQPGGRPAGPYRQAPRPPPVPVPVIVRELVHDRGPEVVGLLARMVGIRRWMASGPAPGRIRAFGQEGRILATVEEHVHGIPLLALLGPCGPMPPEIALSIARGLLPLWTVAEAASPPVRLSVDPNGVLVDAAGQVRALPDYAVERAEQRVGAAVGILQASVSYIAPEQIMGHAVELRSGMFTLGILLYEMLAGGHPFGSVHDTGTFAFLVSMVEADAPPLHATRPDLPPAVTELVERCLARKPAGRFASWRDVSRALGAAQALFPPTGPAGIARYLTSLDLDLSRARPPRVADASLWPTLTHAGHVAIALPERRAEPTEKRSKPRARPPKMPAADPQAVYPGNDARPMIPVSGFFAIDARPVTRGEMHRYCILTGAPRPEGLREASTARDDDPCTGVTVEEAEGYARWAGKRLPTEDQWVTAFMVLGAARLGGSDLWEWTASDHEAGGRVILTGADERSGASGPAPDLGFRCVADVG